MRKNALAPALAPKRAVCRHWDRDRRIVWTVAIDERDLPPADSPVIADWRALHGRAGDD